MNNAWFSGLPGFKNVNPRLSICSEYPRGVLNLFRDCELITDQNLELAAL